MLILFIITGILIIGLKKPSLIPLIIFCQASAMTVICYRMGLAVPLAMLAFAVKALIVPLLLYYIARKTIVFDQNGSVIPVSAIIALVPAIAVAAYFFTRRLNAGSFATAAIFIALIGILYITSRKTMLSQLTGFIVLQNGIFAFTSSFCLTFPLALEILLALDVLLTVFIMVYAIRTIYKNSGSIDIKTFSVLRG